MLHQFFSSKAAPIADILHRVRSLFRSRASGKCQSPPSCLMFEPLEAKHLLTVMTGSGAAVEDEIIISEFLAHNQGGLEDGRGNTPDWIELYNTSEDPLDLTGWHLTDKNGELGKWTFPNTTIAAGEYLIVFASGNDEIDPGGTLHTNFKLDIDGEYLALVKPDGNTIVSQYGSSSSQYPQQIVNISYGVSIESPSVNQFYFTPTPNAANINGVITLGPRIENVLPATEMATESDDLIIRAQITQGDLAVNNNSVTLHYRVMYGAEISVLMADDESISGETSGDGIFAAIIPKSAFIAGEMVRWYVTAADSFGNEAREPRFLDPDESPEYYGTVVADSTIDTELPVLNWFVEDQTWHMNDPNNPFAGNNRNETPASVFYDGKFYDNISVRVRGSLTTQNWAKPKFKFDFNPGNHFKYSTEMPAVEEFNLQSHYKEFLSLPEENSYIRETLSMNLLQENGVPASNAFHMQIRQNGDFYSLASFIEQVDETLLERYGYDPEGALYKAVSPLAYASLEPNSVSEENYEYNYRKVSRTYEDNSDLIDLVNGLNQSGDDLKNYLFDNINLSEVINVIAINTVYSNFDSTGKNHYLYRDSNDTGLWTMIPWDTEQAFPIGNTFNVPWHTIFFGGSDKPQATGHPNALYDAIFNTPETREMYLRRLRSLMDNILDFWPGQIEQRLNDLLVKLLPDATLDAAKWDDFAGWDFGDIETSINNIKNIFVPTRRLQLYEDPLVPAEQSSVNVVIGNPNLDATEDYYETVFNPISGDQDEEYITLINNSIDAVDISDWQLTGEVNFTFQAGTVIPAGGTLYVAADMNAFRARVSGPSGGEGLFIQGDYAGHLSNFGGVLNLLDQQNQQIASITLPEVLSPAQQFLRITELNYNPSGSVDSSEFIELHNISHTESIDLTGVSIDEGPSESFHFTGSNVTTLGPGEYVVVVRDYSAFISTYPSVDSSIIAGEYEGKFNNGGEQIKINDAHGSTILDFNYENGTAATALDWYPETDGAGFSLVAVDSFSDNDLDSASSWRSSALMGGSPGTVDLQPLAADFNGDGQVNANDLTILLKNYGRSSGAHRATGDANHDGAITLRDLLAVKRSFGESLFASSSSPEVESPAAAASLTVIIDKDPQTSQQNDRVQIQIENNELQQGINSKRNSTRHVNPSQRRAKILNETAVDQSILMENYDSFHISQVRRARRSTSNPSRLQQLSGQDI